MVVRWALTRMAVVAGILTTAACPAEEAGTYVSSVSCLGILDRDSIASRPIRITRRDGTTVAGRIRSLSEGNVTLSAEVGAGLGALVGHAAGTEPVEAVEVHCTPVRRDTP
jgi:hypothetical protein